MVDVILSANLRSVRFPECVLTKNMLPGGNDSDKLFHKKLIFNNIRNTSSLFLPFTDIKTLGNRTSIRLPKV